jgi:hypothetical protein
LTLPRMQRGGDVLVGVESHSPGDEDIAAPNPFLTEGSVKVRPWLRRGW